MLKVGHRGAPHIAPGNTMASFRAAHAAGCDWIECDCRVSSDGVVVLSHDPVVRDRTGREHAVGATESARLAALDLGGGEGVPTLDELVEWAIGRVGVMADIKVSGYEAPIAASLRSIATAQRVVSGADQAGRRRFREADPQGPISITVDVAHEAEMEARWAEIDSEAVTLEHPLVTAERAADLHGRGVLVFAWTPDDLATMRHLVVCGVDGVISNRVDLLKAL